jgi:hypothetical protein
MLKPIKLLFFIFLTTSIKGQSIIELFENAPSASVFNLSTVERKAISKICSDNKKPEDVKNDLNNNKIVCCFEIVDVKNGYLKIIGGIDGFMEMCYWELSNGKKMLAIYQEGCGPVCEVVRFDFFETDGKTFKKLNTKTIIPNTDKDFYKTDVATTDKKMEKEDVIATTLYRLPRNGKNISVLWGNEGDVATYKKYGKGNRMSLIWKNGKFEKSTVSWSK